jgi:hypothetical protein
MLIDDILLSVDVRKIQRFTETGDNRILLPITVDQQENIT